MVYKAKIWKLNVMGLMENNVGEEEVYMEMKKGNKIFSLVQKVDDFKKSWSLNGEPIEERLYVLEIGGEIGCTKPDYLSKFIPEYHVLTSKEIKKLDIRIRKMLYGISEEEAEVDREFDIICRKMKLKSPFEGEYD